MCKIIGQTRLMSVLNSYSVATMPKAMLFIGPKGCGKHFIAKSLADRLELDYCELAADISAEELIDKTYSTIKTMYVINLDEFSEKQQNALLKFIEEPSDTVFTVLVASSTTSVIDTILNRCIKHSFDSYSAEELQQILGKTVDAQALAIFKTPGKLQLLTDKTFASTIATATHIVKNSITLPYVNFIAIIGRVNFKDFYDKIDFELLLDAVSFVAFEDFVNTASVASINIFNVTNEFKQFVTNTRFIKEMLMVNYLTRVWEAARSETIRT